MTRMTRTGTCLCGLPVAAHFDDRNVKFDCAFVARLHADETAHLEQPANQEKVAS